MAFPKWVRLVREEDTFTGFVSKDGNNWTKIRSVTIPMGRDLYACLAATSHLSGTVTTVEVAGFKAEGTFTPPEEWPGKTPR